MFQLRMPFIFVTFSFYSLLLFISLVECNFFTNETSECFYTMCEKVVTCPMGFYIKSAQPSKGKCCSTCEPFAKIGDRCNDITDCSPPLRCSRSYERNIDEKVCVYAWENNDPLVNCDTSSCITYEACEKGLALKKHDGIKTCCDTCIRPSNYGEYCDDEQHCTLGLNCMDNICMESDFCKRKKKNCETIGDCGHRRYWYRIPANGLDRCCDVCLPYAKLGEKCDIRYCIIGTSCNSGICVKWKYDCSAFQCLEKETDCVNGIWISADQNFFGCCPYCRPYANYAEFCNDEYPCNPKFECKNNKCDLKSCYCE